MKTLFVNAAQVSFSPMDVQILARQEVRKMAQGDKQEVDVTDEMALVMSPVQAKLLLLALHKMIQAMKPMFLPLSCRPMHGMMDRG